MKLLHMMICLLVTFGLTACESGDELHIHYSSAPELYSFNMIDSYGVNTELDHTTALALHPYEYGGWFDLSWEVGSRRDYFVEVSINDRPVWDDTAVIGEGLCGAGLACGSWGAFICRYDSDFYLGCGQTESEADFNQISVYHLIDDLPQRVFLNLRVCDAAGGGCEMNSLDVWLY
jgi:hypothetical protein